MCPKTEIKRKGPFTLRTITRNSEPPKRFIHPPYKPTLLQPEQAAERLPSLVLFCSFYRFHIFLQTGNIPTYQSSVGFLQASPCVFVIVNRYATGLEPGMPLKHLHTTQDLVHESLLNHYEGLRSTFPKTDTKFDAHSLFLSLICRVKRRRPRTRLQINARENCLLTPSYVQRGTLTHWT
jgi:hypothetical protein